MMNGIHTDIEVLYPALARLTTSSRPLKAMSDYPASLGAVRGLLIEAYPQPRVLEEWAAAGLHSLGPDGAALVELMPDDVTQPLFVNTPTLNQLELICGTLALLPLVTNKRSIGWLAYVWEQPVHLDAGERRLLTALAEQSAPVFDLLWSLSGGQRKVIELQMAKRESEILRSASNQLSQATDAVSLLEAVSAYPRLTGASSGRLAYYDGGELRTVALWQKGSVSHEVAGELLELEAAATDDDVILLDARYSTSDASRAVLHLNGRGAWMGTLVFDWDQRNYFNERDRYLYKALAQQISAVIDSIQLFEQINLRAQRAERHLLVNAALSTATDEVQILEALAEYPQVRAADYVALSYLDADTTDEAIVQPVVALQDGQAFYYANSEGRYPAVRSPINTLWLAAPESLLLIEDVAADERLTMIERDRMLHELGAHAAAVMPLFSNGRYQGVLHVLWRQPHIFSEDEKYVYEEIRQSLPAYVASRRAYLEQEEARRETEQRAHELATVAQISAIISSILDEDLLLDKVAEVTRASFPDYRILIYMLVNQTTLLRISAQQGGHSHTASSYRLPLSQLDSLIAAAARTRQTLAVDDITASSEYKLKPLMPDARAEMAIPMLAGDEVIGVVDVQAPIVGRFSGPDARVIKTLVEMIAVALQNARLYQQARQLAVAEERNRLARELHDSVSQALYGIVLGANTSQALLQAKQYDQLESAVGYVLSLAKAGLDEIRASIFDLRPVVLQDQGLIQAITTHANALQIRHGIRVNAALCAEPELPFQIKEEIYRIARESLHNIVKHAQATQVNLRLTCSEEMIELHIEDNGIGFDPTKPHASLGLKSMRERAASLKGTLTITSTPGAGTQIAAAIPLPH